MTKIECKKCGYKGVPEITNYLISELVKYLEKRCEKCGNILEVGWQSYEGFRKWYSLKEIFNSRRQKYA